MNAPFLIASLAALALLGGCAKEKTSYGDAKGVETLTNQFGSTDLQMMAESMARSMLSAPVITAANLPIVTVQEVRNKTSEYIDTRGITDSIRSELQKGGKVRFAVDQAAMNQQVEELKRQQNSGLYDKESAVEMGRMAGAQYRLEGHRQAGEGLEGRVLQAQPAALEHPQRTARVVRRKRNPQDHHPRLMA
jgi:uncharacterized protein (TIGR02722 family)